MDARRDVGYWIGVVSCALVAGLAMVQVRSWLGPLPSGDWPKDGITWHFLPLFGLALLVWAGLARLTAVSMERLGRIGAPLLGLVVTWTWYGITDPALHALSPGGCTVYPVCHDSGPFLVVWWSAPWLAWAGWRLRQVV